VVAMRGQPLAISLAFLKQNEMQSEIPKPNPKLCE